MAVCEMCQAEVEDQDVLTLEGTNICASCKPVALAKLQEQGNVATGPLYEYEWRDFRSLRAASVTVRVLAFLWALAAVFYLLAGGGLTFVAGPAGLLMVPFAVLFGFASYGAYTRKGWGRGLGLTLGWIGLVLGSLGLILVLVNRFTGSENAVRAVVQVLIAVLAIRSFRRKELFGPDRLDPKEIREVWIDRKRNKT